jgi:hypothetical protein
MTSLYEKGTMNEQQRQRNRQIANEILDLWDIPREPDPEPDALELYYGHSRQKKKPAHIRIDHVPDIRPRQGCYIYVLVDPTDDTIRYVGSTADIFSRALEHESADEGNPHLNAWVSLLMERETHPVMRVIAQCRYEDRWDEEDFWIIKYRDEFRLLNKGTNRELKEYRYRRNGW